MDVIEIDGKEYTQDELAKKIQNADQHIEKLEGENKDFRQKVDEYMELVKNQKPQEPSAPQTAKPNDDPGQPAGLSEEEVAELVKKSVKQISVDEQIENNLTTLGKALADKFGGKDEGKTALEQKAREMGLAEETVTKLAAENPQVVLSWFDIKATAPTWGSAHNTEAVTTQSGGSTEGTYDWWKQIRRNDPTYYFSPKATAQRMKDAERLGREKFFNK